MTATEAQEARVIRVLPGDVIFIRVAKGTQLNEIVQDIKELWPDNEVLIGEEMELSIMRTG